MPKTSDILFQSLKPGVPTVLVRPEGIEDGLLIIGTGKYRFRTIPLPPHTEVRKLIRLTGGRHNECYDISESINNWYTCTCGDYHFRGCHAAQVCKHVTALVQHGLF